MANVPTQLSPGVNITEIDLSGIVREAGNNTASFVGQFRWGPADESLLIDNERRFTDIFLPPTNDLPEKMQDDFFSATNFFRYSDKLKIVRIVHETARNSRAGQASPASPILIPNEEAFFSRADPTNIGAKNYNVVLSGANWIARYPGDIGNSLKVTAIGAGTYIEGTDEPDGGEGEGGEGGNEIPPQRGSFYLPIKQVSQFLPGVTTAMVTVPVVVDMLNGPYGGGGRFGGAGSTWPHYFIGNGTTLPTGNTFGMKYFCIWLRGASYCQVPGTFPIPGGSYAYIPGSNVTGGLTLSPYYRDRWFYGTFGTEADNTDGTDWTQEGPLLSARLAVGVTLSISTPSGGVTFSRLNTLGKGFHGSTGSAYTQRNWVYGMFRKNNDQQAFEGQSAMVYPTNIGSVPFIYAADPFAGWLNAAGNFLSSAPIPTEVRQLSGDGTQTVGMYKPSVLPQFNYFTLPWLFNGCSSPSLVILPFDNSQATPMLEPYTNEFRSYPGGGGYQASVDYGGKTFAGQTLLRTAEAYRNIKIPEPFVWRWTATGVTNDTNNEALFPLRRVIDAFPGITHSSQKGMLIMMCHAQTIDGMTTGHHSTWHVGITSENPFLVAAGLSNDIFTNISNNNGLPFDGTNGATQSVDGGSPFSKFYQFFYGLKAEYDMSGGLADPKTNGYKSRKTCKTENNDPRAGSGGIIILDLVEDFSHTAPCDPFTGGQAQPFREDELNDIVDLEIKKREV